MFRIIKFSDSHYTTPQHIEKIEDRGRQGDVILVEGVRTGSAYVWAKLRDTAYTVSIQDQNISYLYNLVNVCVSTQVPTCA